MPQHSFRVFADYFQFYIQDEGVDGSLAEAWSDQAVQDHLAVTHGTVGIGTARNMEVPVTIEVLTAEPPLAVEHWDHVVEAGIEIASGRLVVAGCTEYLPTAPRISLAPGQYRARVHYGGLDSLTDDGLDGDDHYHIALWPAPMVGVTILKRHRPSEGRAV